MSVFYEFDEVDTFTAAAVGEPGSRVFYLQARAGDQRVTVKCEKQQVTAIAQYLRRVLSDLPPAEHRPMAGARRACAAASSRSCSGRSGSATTAATTACSSSSRSSSRPTTTTRTRTTSSSAADRGHVRLYMTRSQAAAFCDHADELVAAGRPSCMWCGKPIDPDGHPCPRMN